MVMAVDISSSIDETELVQMRNALTNIAKGFAYGPELTNVGIVQFDKLGRLVLPLVQGTTLDVVTAAIGQIGNIVGRGGTAISSGVRNGTTELLTGRPGTYKLLITVTDGGANTLFSGASCDSVNTDTPPNGCSADIADSIQRAKAVLSPAAFFSLGIGEAIIVPQLITLADGITDQYTFIDQFLNFQNFVAKIITDVCAALPGPPCTEAPTEAPTNQPTAAPTTPTNQPTQAPTQAPTNQPTEAPTGQPTPAPTLPTAQPTLAPTNPTEAPTSAPTIPTNAPTFAPTLPTEAPTEGPTVAPTAPTEAPTESPTFPTDAPTEVPTAPTETPTEFPTGAPTPPTEAPTGVPTFACLCDDGNLCTTDTCNQTNGACINTPIVCTQLPGADNCSVLSCNRNNGTCTNVTNTCSSVNKGALIGGIVGGLAAVAAVAVACLALVGASTSGGASSASGSGLFGTDSSVVNSGIFTNSMETGSNPLNGYYEL